MKLEKCALFYILGTTIWGLFPGMFLNYGYDYYQYLDWRCLLIPVILCMAVLIICRKKWGSGWVKSEVVFSCIAALLLPLAFYFFRTRIHCFGGDGNVGTVITGDWSIKDWIPPIPGKGRLDGYGGAFISRCCRSLGIFEIAPELTTMTAAAIYAIVMGCVFVVLAVIWLHRRVDLLLILLTGPYMFNFFGNVDNYTFSIVIALVFLIASSNVYKSETVRLPPLVGLVCLWGVGMWTHPFHVFEGFIIAYLSTRYLKRWSCFSRLPDWGLSMLFGILLFIAIKISPWGNTWFEWKFAEVPSTFSIDTLTHYLNMILLPSLPIVVALTLSSAPRKDLRLALYVFIASSAVFFAMAFTLGAVDQFNYQHLFFFFLMPWLLLAIQYKLPKKVAICVAICQIALLVPMIAVHSSDLTVARAERLYPIDLCKHNRIMSWQTHLGLCLGDNNPDNPIVKRSVLRTFANGARRAEPAGFRGGNYIYHTAFLYHFGDFEQGRRQLFDLLRQNPEAVKWFLGDRPAFIYFNRKQLWNDIDDYLAADRSPMLASYRKFIADIEKRVKEHPYHIKLPMCAKTEY